MVRIKIGITGNQGFIGTHLTNYLRTKAEIEVVSFDKQFFKDIERLKDFVKACDVIVHLAAMNRHEDPQVIYNTNVELVNQLIAACVETNSTPHILFSSSTQEDNDNLYGASKLHGRLALENWAKSNGASVTGLVIPNVFGPFGKPYYNSVVATFCHQLTHNEQPQIKTDNEVNLIYVNELVDEICKLATDTDLLEKKENRVLKVAIQPRYKIKVSEILTLLQSYQSDYLEKGIFPDLTDNFKRALFNTFRCYVPTDYYPRLFKLNSDNRGTFVEIARTETPGQTSFSTTFPGITRGNHYHTRKAERFAVIKGEARIQLRKIGTDDVINYALNGDAPAYVDMPVWFTHNITNIGQTELIVIFWINEPFNAEDPDTFFENV